MKKNPVLYLLCVFTLSATQFPIAQQLSRADICIYGATSAGVMAAYSAAKLGKKVILVDPDEHIGGLTSGGLGYTDIGNKYAISGLSLDYYRRLGKHYGKFEQWIFEPHVAENLFREYLDRVHMKPLFSHKLKAVNKNDRKIRSAIFAKLNGEEIEIEAEVFIDCTYEGDLMAMAGVSFIVGREANASYGETYNGVQLRDKHQFSDGTDPYKTKGDPTSGLLWGISPEKVDVTGAGDSKLQAYNFRICLTDSIPNQIPISRPVNYDSTKYELLLRVLEKEPDRPFNLIMKPDLMTNRKTDINNNGPFSTDMIGMNYNYANADWETRKKIQKSHEDYNKGFLYFVGHDPRMPEHLRKEMLRWGYPKDEYEEYGNWSPQMYIREARRMKGAYVMTQANCEGKHTVEDAVGMAAYTMDSHNCQRIVIEKDGVKMVKNEGDVQVGGFPPYPISYRSLIPVNSECTNILVPVCLSATHIAYGSIRMEPVFMVLAQSAAYAASLSIDSKKSVQDIDVKKLQQLLRENPLADGSIPDILVDNENQGVKVSGAWEKNSDRSSYAVSSYRIKASDTKARVQFGIDINTNREYSVYTYLPKIKDGASAIQLEIKTGKKLQQSTIDLKNFQVTGQTSGEWVFAGKYMFEKGANFVAITNQGADGIVIADAILLVPDR